MAAGATYEPIATQTLGSAAASITFSSIAASWTDLRFVFVGSMASTTNPIIQINGDTSSTNYSRTFIQGQGTSATSGRSTVSSNVILGYFNSSTLPGMITIDFFSYASSLYKTFLSTSNADTNGGGYLNQVIGLWQNTSAINSITLSTISGANWSAGSTATIYGIKAA